ncbi:cell wall-active antibiotics response protein LiaF [Streptococcaceae bacterium ESL0729]|nr:cell wall-active antibiotics response protein LiaF [Streptococcaceae bacterium ESL0729]
MKTRLFIILELIFLIASLVTLIGEPIFAACLILTVVIGMLLSKFDWFIFKLILTVLGLVMAIFVFENFFFWLALILAVIAIVYFVRLPKKQQNFDMIETYYDEWDDRVFIKENLDFSRISGQELYRFDDINIIKVISDDVIDLEQTNFRQDENIIMLRKFIGDTKIIVPKGMAVSVDYASLRGGVNLFGERSNLSKERIKYYSDDFTENPRRLKIYVDTFMGDLTVVCL